MIVKRWQWHVPGLLDVDAVESEVKTEVKVEEVKSASVDEAPMEQEYDTRSEAGSSNSGSEQSGSASPALSSLADDDSAVGDDDDNEDIYANFGMSHLRHDSCCLCVWICLIYTVAIHDINHYMLLVKQASFWWGITDYTVFRLTYVVLMQEVSVGWNEQDTRRVFANIYSSEKLFYIQTVMTRKIYLLSGIFPKVGLTHLFYIRLISLEHVTYMHYICANAYLYTQSCCCFYFRWRRRERRGKEERSEEGHLSHSLP